MIPHYLRYSALEAGARETKIGDVDEAASSSQSSERSSPATYGSPTSWIPSETRISPLSEEVKIWKKSLCAKREQENAREQLTSFCSCPMRIQARSESRYQFNVADPCSFGEILQNLQDAIIAVFHKKYGEEFILGNENAPIIFLKGSLASQAVLGHSLADLVEQGSDIDLQTDAVDWAPAGITWSEWSQLMGDAAVVWVVSILRRMQPRDVLEALSKAELDLYSRRFFSTRYATDGSNLNSAWALYRIDVELPNSTINHIDFTAAYRLVRSFLSDDSAYQISFPSKNRPTQALVWTNPRESLQHLRLGEFSVPDPEGLERGWLEKILVKQARGMRFRGAGDQEEKEHILAHFQRGCANFDSKQDWKKTASFRLRCAEESLKTPFQRILFQLQLVQIFPDWKELEHWPEPEEWPEAMRPFERFVRETEGFERAEVLGNLGPFIAAWMTSHQWVPMAVWPSRWESFLDRWLIQGTDSLERRFVSDLALGQSSGEINLNLLVHWLGRLQESAHQGQDARLLLGMLARVPAGLLPTEQMAARCALEMIDPTECYQMLKEWPTLQSALSGLNRLAPRVFLHLSSPERRGMILDLLKHWKGLPDFLETLENIDISPLARFHAMWRALVVCVETKRSFPQYLLAWASQAELPLERSEAIHGVLCDLILEGDALSEHSLNLISGYLREPLSDRLIGREARAWIKLLHSKSLTLRLQQIHVLVESVINQRWANVTPVISKAVLGAIESWTGTQADGLWAIIERFMKVQTNAWEFFPKALLEGLSFAQGMAYLTLAYKEESWTPTESAFLTKWLSDEKKGIEALRHAVGEGWQITESWHWRHCLAACESCENSKQFGAILQQIFAMTEAALEPPDDAIQSYILKWVVDRAELWAFRRQSKGIASSLGQLQQIASLWEEKWGLQGLSCALLEGWAILLRRNVDDAEFWTPVGVNPRNWLLFVLNHYDGYQGQDALEGRFNLWIPALETVDLIELQQKCISSNGRLAAWLENQNLLQRREFWKEFLIRGIVQEENVEAIANHCALGNVEEIQSKSNTVQWLSAWLPILSKNQNQEIAPRWFTESIEILNVLIKKQSAIPILIELRKYMLGVCRHSARQATPENQRYEQFLAFNSVIEKFSSYRLLEGFWIKLVVCSSAISERKQKVELSEEDLNALEPLLRGIIPSVPLAPLLVEAAAVGPGLVSRGLRYALRYHKGLAEETHDGYPLLEVLEALFKRPELFANEPEAELILLLEDGFEIFCGLIARTTKEERLACPIWKIVAAWLNFAKHLEPTDNTFKYGFELQQRVIRTVERMIEDNDPRVSSSANLADLDGLVAINSIGIAFSNSPRWLPYTLQTLENLADLSAKLDSTPWGVILHKIYVTLTVASWSMRVEDLESLGNEDLWRWTIEALITSSGLNNQIKGVLLKSIMRPLSHPNINGYSRAFSLRHLALCWAAASGDEKKIAEIWAQAVPEDLGWCDLVHPVKSREIWESAFSALGEQVLAFREIERSSGVRYEGDFAGLLPRLFCDAAERAMMSSPQGLLYWIQMVEACQQGFLPSNHLEQITTAGKAAFLSSAFGVAERLANIQSKSQSKDSAELLTALDRLRVSLLQDLITIENDALGNDLPFFAELFLTRLRFLSDTKSKKQNTKSVKNKSQKDLRNEGRLPDSFGNFEGWTEEVGKTALSINRSSVLIEMYSSVNRFLNQPMKGSVQARKYAEKWIVQCVDRISELQISYFLHLERVRSEKTALSESEIIEFECVTKALVKVVELDSFLFNLAVQWNLTLRHAITDGLAGELQWADGIKRLEARFLQAIEQALPEKEGYAVIEALSTMADLKIQGAICSWWARWESAPRPRQDQIEFEEARAVSLQNCEIALKVFHRPLTETSLSTLLNQGASTSQLDTSKSL